MIRKYYLEFIVGIFMIAGILALAVLAFKVSGLTWLNDRETYLVTAEFTHIGDLKVRAPVTIAGVTIGRVTKITLDPVTFKAVVTLSISAREKEIPTDSTADIYTAGLIGSNYVSITPGFDETFLKEGSKIENTNQALILQNIIGQLIYKTKGDNDRNNK